MADNNYLFNSLIYILKEEKTAQCLRNDVASYMKCNQCILKELYNILQLTEYDIIKVRKDIKRGITDGYPIAICIVAAMMRKREIIVLDRYGEFDRQICYAMMNIDTIEDNPIFLYSYPASIDTKHYDALIPIEGAEEQVVTFITNYCFCNDFL